MQNTALSSIGNNGRLYRVGCLSCLLQSYELVRLLEVLLGDGVHALLALQQGGDVVPHLGVEGGSGAGGADGAGGMSHSPGRVSPP